MQTIETLISKRKKKHTPPTIKSKQLINQGTQFLLVGHITFVKCYCFFYFLVIK